MITRRHLLGSLLVPAVMASDSVVAAVCRRTPAQDEGPFYPKKDRMRDADLTRWSANGAEAKGEVIEIYGTVMGTDCQPIWGATVEIWQASESGRYNHSGDKNPLPLDPDFQYWGRNQTNVAGEYSFRTIIPGYYPLNPSLVGQVPTAARQFRPPHIHFRVRATGYLALTTQLYFDPQSRSDQNWIDVVTKLNRWENVDPDLTVLFSPDTSGLKNGTFDIVLSPQS
jgi:protocatechuate 3,4-dioxygenase, beta subunit